jgi:hypothetical protein
LQVQGPGSPDDGATKGEAVFELEMWNYRRVGDGGDEPGPETVDLTGFGVEAIDGSIGKVDAASHETDSSLIVVDTGPWIFGKKVMLPAGVIDRIDLDDEKVYVHRTKEEIKHAPEYDDALSTDMSYRARLAQYYGPEGKGYRAYDATREGQLLRR